MHRNRTFHQKYPFKMFFCVLLPPFSYLTVPPPASLFEPHSIKLFIQFSFYTFPTLRPAPRFYHYKGTLLTPAMSSPSPKPNKAPSPLLPSSPYPPFPPFLTWAGGRFCFRVRYFYFIERSLWKLSVYSPR